MHPERIARPDVPLAPDWPWLIPLGGRGGVIRGYVIVDETDYEHLSRFRWALFSNRYAARALPRPDRFMVRMHRQLLGLERGDPREGDHKNGDGLDNRRSNLRIVTRAQQQQNQASNVGSTSRYRGVYWSTTLSRWVAFIGLYRGKGMPKRKVTLGYFDDEDEAGAVAEAARDEYMPYAVRR